MKRLSIILPLLLLFSGFFLFAQEGADTDLIARGRTVFREAGGVGCKTCHGVYALGDLQIGPNVRGVDEVRIRGALEAAEEMEFLLPLVSPEDIVALAAYLQHLGTLEPVAVTYRSDAFNPAEVSVPAGSAVQLIVNNGNRSDCTLTAVDTGAEAVTIPGRDSGDIVWTTPEAPATLTAFCAEAPEGTLAIVVEAGQ